MGLCLVFLLNSWRFKQWSLYFLCLLLGSFYSVCFPQFWRVNFSFIFLYLFYYYPLETCFLMIDKKEVDLDGLGGGKELGGIE